MHFGTTASPSTLAIEKNEKKKWRRYNKNHRHTACVLLCWWLYWTKFDDLSYDCCYLFGCSSVHCGTGDNTTTATTKKGKKSKKRLKSANDVLKIDVLFNNIHIFCAVVVVIHHWLYMCSKVMNDHWQNVRCKRWKSGKASSALSSPSSKWKAACCCAHVHRKLKLKLKRIASHEGLSNELNCNTEIHTLWRRLPLLPTRINGNIAEKNCRCPAPFNMFIRTFRRIR